jgi:chromosome condensin MukBEF ATPase and DNA-binding subunit MukB
MFKSGASFHDRNKIKAYAEQGIDVAKISRLTRVPPKVVKSVIAGDFDVNPEEKLHQADSNTAELDTNSIPDDFFDNEDDEEEEDAEEEEEE